MLTQILNVEVSVKNAFHLGQQDSSVGTRACHRVVKYWLRMCEALGLVPSSGGKNV